MAVGKLIKKQLIKIVMVFYSFCGLAEEVAITAGDYCQRFALQYAENLSHSYRVGSLKVTKNGISDEHIQARYTCRFQTVTVKGAYHEIFVTIFVIADQDFALAIKERRWYIIPVARIKIESEENEKKLKEGYGVFMSHEKSPPLPPTKEPANLMRDRSPSEYCQSFAKAYTLKEDLILGSVYLETENLTDKLEKWASNFFQPSGSRFIIGYKCRFKTNPPENKREKSSVLVYLFLVETYNFAKHTSMEEEQIIPIEYIKDIEKEGYGVFKFLEIQKNP